jgi:hypothetical protein
MILPLVDCLPPPALSTAPTQEAIAGDLVNLAEAYQSCRAAILMIRQNQSPVSSPPPSP